MSKAEINKAEYIAKSYEGLRKVVNDIDDYEILDFYRHADFASYMLQHKETKDKVVGALTNYDIQYQMRIQKKTWVKFMIYLGATLQPCKAYWDSK